MVGYTRFGENSTNMPEISPEQSLEYRTSYLLTSILKGCGSVFPDVESDFEI